MLGLWLLGSCSQHLSELPTQAQTLKHASEVLRLPLCSALHHTLGLHLILLLLLVFGS